MKDSIVFTNGCFDIIHPGHITLLREAKSLGDHLIIGLNSDSSVKMLKGSSRPIVPQESRKLILESIKYVDEVIIFDQKDPLSLIMKIKPNVLVKGGDYQADEVIGSQFVKGYGGSVVIINFLEGFSTTSIINDFKRK